MADQKIKFKTETVMHKRILIVTNDSTVFNVKKKLASAFEMFGGRVTEVKKLVARLDTATKEDGSKLCDVSYGVITTKYGFVPGNYTISDYEDVMSDRAGYEDCEKRKQFIEQVGYLSQPFDMVIMCVPKDMFAMFLEADVIRDGVVVAITSPEFKEACEKKKWTFMERSGARVGNENADAIEALVRKMCA